MTDGEHILTIPRANPINAYGPTETSVCATVEKWTDETLKVTIGRPIANTQVYILEKDSPILQIKTIVNWQQEHTLVKTAFPR